MAQDGASQLISIYTYRYKGLTGPGEGIGSRGPKEASMFKRKPKAYRVVLDGEIGGHSMLIIVGCSDVDECIEYTNRTKEKGQSIFDIQEIVR